LFITINTSITLLLLDLDLGIRLFTTSKSVKIGYKLNLINVNCKNKNNQV